MPQVAGFQFKVDIVVGTSFEFIKKRALKLGYECEDGRTFSSRFYQFLVAGTVWRGFKAGGLRYDVLARQGPGSGPWSVLAPALCQPDFGHWRVGLEDEAMEFRKPTKGGTFDNAGSDMSLTFSPMEIGYALAHRDEKREVLAEVPVWQLVDFYARVRAGELHYPATGEAEDPYAGMAHAPPACAPHFAVTCEAWGAPYVLKGKEFVVTISIEPMISA